MPSSRFGIATTVSENASAGADGAGLRRAGSRVDGKAWMIFIYLTLFCVFIASYRFYLAPYWAYMGFIDRFNPYKFFASMGIMIPFILLTPREFSVRSFFLNMSITAYLLPSLTIYSYSDRNNGDMLLILMAFCIVYSVSSISIPRASIPAVPTKSMMWIFGILISCFSVSLFLFVGLRNFNLDLSRVYEFREDAANSAPGIFGYLVSVFSSTIIPICIIASIKYRFYIFTIFFFIMSVLIFGFTSYKSVLLYPFVITGLYIFLSKYNRYSVILYVLISLMCVGLISEFFSISHAIDSFMEWYKTLLIRRALMIPPLLDYYYIEFFSGSPKYYWSSSFITFGLVPDYYGIAAPKVIGDVYFSDPGLSANTGFIGSGFAQAGALGLALYAAGVGAIFAIFQSYGRYLGQSFVAAAMMGQVAILLRASDFLTTFLTHGLLVSLLLLVLLSPSEE